MRARSPHTDNNRLSTVVHPLKKSLGIDFVSYALYSNNNIDFYHSSPFSDEIDTFINDPKSLLPGSAADKTTTLSWHDFCSEEFIYRCKYLYDYNPDGIVLYLKHRNFSEHISLGTTDLQLNIAKMMRRQPQLKQEVVSFIRSKVNFNKQLYQPQSYNLDNIKQSKPNSHIVSHSLTERGNLYVYGNLGSTHITLIEKECLEYTLQLYTAKQISKKLCLSSKTIESHIANVKKRLGASTRHALYIIAKNNNLILH